MEHSSRVSAEFW